ncbi:MAG: thiolase domain-containing protein, partial [Reyranella sp.]|nr:thiolase domain-containing protein [Reyranella sp.]
MSIRGKAYIAGIYEHPTRLAKVTSLAQIHRQGAKGALERRGSPGDAPTGASGAGARPG